MVPGTCALCLQDRGLCDSHYLPAAIFSLLRTDGDSPIVLSPSLIMPTDRPVMAPLLCRDCEHKLTEHGEDYTMSVINRFDTFRLLEIINSAKRYRQERDERAYFGADLPVNRDALAYFALSVIWRGAVKVWTKHGGNHTGGLRLDKQDKRAFASICWVTSRSRLGRPSRSQSPRTSGVRTAPSIHGSIRIYRASRRFSSTPSASSLKSLSARFPMPSETNAASDHRTS